MKNKRGSKPHQAAAESGPRSTGKSIEATVTRRDDHPGKKAEKPLRDALIIDQRKTAATRGEDAAYPKHSTGAKFCNDSKCKICSN